MRRFYYLASQLAGEETYLGMLLIDRPLPPRSCIRVIWISEPVLVFFPSKLEAIFRSIL